MRGEGLWYRSCIAPSPRAAGEGAERSEGGVRVPAVVSRLL